MISFDAMCRMASLEPGELDRWVAERWVLPESVASGYVFNDVDVARVRLIVELRRDLAVGEESVPVVLRLLDQLYATRRRMRTLLRAIEALPEEHRAALIRRLEGQ